jgi:peptidoglycan/LPS O-acetylase OafA/YrhL
MLHSQPSRLGTLLLLVAAVVGFVVALYAWYTPLTGVTGTIGALGVAIDSIVLALLTFALRGATRRGMRIFLVIITLVMLVGIGFAAALLHQYIITAAMVVGLIGLIMLSRRSVHHHHRVNV